ncbi:MAG TPA: hypothetical protein VE913_17745, partial [Longimicrobium sp.]|nr:hypothetical protein [Longimicrobium sp.]
GTLFPADDPAALAVAVAGLLADRGSWDARRARGRAFVESERNWDVNVARYDGVYQTLTTRGVSTRSWSRSPSLNA